MVDALQEDWEDCFDDHENFVGNATKRILKAYKKFGTIMFGFLGKSSKFDTGQHEPSVDWNPKTRVLTCVDRKGHKTVRKNPSSMSSSLYDVTSMEMVRDQARFTLHPKPQKNKDGLNKPRLVTFSLKEKMVGGRML